MLSPKPSGTVDNMTIVCEEEGISMVTTIEEVSFPLRHADNSMWKAHRWLLMNLPSLPHFDTVRPTCCCALRQVCCMLRGLFLYTL